MEAEDEAIVTWSACMLIAFQRSIVLHITALCLLYRMSQCLVFSFTIALQILVLLHLSTNVQCDSVTGCTNSVQFIVLTNVYHKPKKSKCIYTYIYFYTFMHIYITYCRRSFMKIRARYS